MDLHLDKKTHVKEIHMMNSLLYALLGNEYLSDIEECYGELFSKEEDNNDSESTEETC